MENGRAIVSRLDEEPGADLGNNGKNKGRKRKEENISRRFEAEHTGEIEGSGNKGEKENFAGNFEGQEEQDLRKTGNRNKGERTTQVKVQTG